MKTTTLLAFAIISMLIIFNHATVNAAEGQDQPQVRAVLIGINDYSSNALAYCVNDITGVADVLQKSGCDDLTVILDRDATTKNVQQTLRDVISRCGESDVFLFYYSGHGFYKNDIDGDEPDGIDETIVLVTENGNPKNFLDDDLDKILESCKAQNVIVIFDSCHSGGAVRSVIKPRVLEPGARPSFKNQGDPSAFTDVPPSNEKSIVITASKKEEFSGESSVLKHGVFSYFFLNALNNEAPVADANKDGFLTFSEIYDYCLINVPNHNPNQHPTFYKGPKVSAEAYFTIDTSGNVQKLVVPGTASIVEPVPLPSTEQTITDVVKMLEEAGKINSEFPKYELYAATDKSSYGENDEIKLEISIDEQCYMYVVNVYYGGEVSLLFPNGVNSENLIQPGKKITIADLTDGAKLQIQPGTKSGNEWFLVIASPVELPIVDMLKSGIQDGEISSDFKKYKYGLKGLLTEISSESRIKLKPAVIVRDDVVEDLPPEGAISRRSVAAYAVKYEVR